MINLDSVLFKIAKKAKKVNLNKIINQAIKMNQDELIDLNRDMLRMGNDANGFLPNYSSLDYSLEKRSMPSYQAPYPRMDLNYTGSYQNKKKLKIEGDKISFPSSDVKNKDLTSRFGEEINELDKEQKEIAQSIITPDFFVILNKALR